MMNSPTLNEIIQIHDNPVLKFLKDIRISTPDLKPEDPSYLDEEHLEFTLQFHFADANPYFSNSVRLFEIWDNIICNEFYPLADFNKRIFSQMRTGSKSSIYIWWAWSDYLQRLQNILEKRAKCNTKGNQSCRAKFVQKIQTNLFFSRLKDLIKILDCWWQSLPKGTVFSIFLHPQSELIF